MSLACFPSSWDLLDLPSHPGGLHSMHSSLRTFPKSCGCYRYMSLLCSFGHSPCLTPWRQSLISRWDGKFGSSMVFLFPSQNHPACITVHIVEERGHHPIYNCLMGKQLWHLLPLVRSEHRCFPHSSSLHPLALYLASPSVSFPAWRDQQQTSFLDPIGGDHTKIPSSACEGQGEPAQAQR